MSAPLAPSNCGGPFGLDALRYNGRTLTIGASTEGGVSAFDYGEDLTYLFAHESQHVAQAEGESRWTRWWMQLFYHAVPSFKRAFEADAVTYGCRNADVGAGYARRCRP